MHTSHAHSELMWKTWTCWSQWHNSHWLPRGQDSIQCS